MWKHAYGFYTFERLLGTLNSSGFMVNRIWYLDLIVSKLVSSALRVLCLANQIRDNMFYLPKSKTKWLPA